MKTKSIIKKEHSAQGLQLLSSNIESLTKKLLGQAGFVQLELIKNWPDIVGENLAQNSLPERIDYKKGERAAGTLVLSVSSGLFLAYAVASSTKSVIISVSIFPILTRESAW